MGASCPPGDNESHLRTRSGEGTGVIIAPAISLERQQDGARSCSAWYAFRFPAFPTFSSLCHFKPIHTVKSDELTSQTSKALPQIELVELKL